MNVVPTARRGTATPPRRLRCALSRCSLTFGAGVGACTPEMPTAKSVTASALRGAWGPKRPSWAGEERRMRRRVPPRKRVAPACCQRARIAVSRWEWSWMGGLVGGLVWNAGLANGRLRIWHESEVGTHRDEIRRRLVARRGGCCGRHSCCCSPASGVGVDGVEQDGMRREKGAVDAVDTVHMYWFPKCGVEHGCQVRAERGCGRMRSWVTSSGSMLTKFETAGGWSVTRQRTRDGPTYQITAIITPSTFIVCISGFTRAIPLLLRRAAAS